VIIANSEDIICKNAIHKLSIISKVYNMKITIDKTNVLASKGGKIRIKIVVKERIRSRKPN
jgi:hypothetical protein